MLLLLILLLLLFLLFSTTFSIDFVLFIDVIFPFSIVLNSNPLIIKKKKILKISFYFYKYIKI